MPAAIPLTTTATVQPAGLRLAVIACGMFGDRVAANLLDVHARGKKLAAADMATAFETAGDVVVVALWRPEPSLWEQADQLAARHGVPWLPITLDHRAIHVGPLVCSSAPCFRCYWRRRQQHDVQPAATSALIAAYAADSSVGPAGYLPHHARIAAMIASEMLRFLAVGPADDRDGLAPGNVATIRLRGEGITISPVVACHGCDRCGSAQGAVGNLGSVVSELRAARVRSAAGAALLGVGPAR
jgi:hypothetical protein